MKNKGFLVIELMLVVAIMGLFTFFGTKAYDEIKSCPEPPVAYSISASAK